MATAAIPEEIIVQVIPVPKEMLELIPYYNGDKRQLNLFLRKCEYVINRYRGHEEQNIYLLHAITSKLTQDAAALLSEREDISSWSALKEVLQQHFGDPRSEECIAIELESCKIKTGETYLDFCNRLQNIRSVLISKVNLLHDPQMKRAKITIYNNTALNVFLYNLPENMVRVVRLKTPATLEDALSVVLEEVNFHEQYTSKNKINSTSKPSAIPSGFRFDNTPKFVQQPIGFRPFTSNNAMPSRFCTPQVNQNVRPQFGYKPPQFGYKPPQFGYKPPQFGYRPPQFGYRPQQPHSTAPQQFGYKPPQIQQPRFQATDISMKTAPVKPQQSGFRLNELDATYDEQYYTDYEPCDATDYAVDPCYEHPDVEHYYDSNTENTSENENFQVEASIKIEK